MSQRARNHTERLRYLLNGIKNSSFSWVVANSGKILPVAPIVAEIIVAEEALIPFCTDSPINLEMFG